MATMHSLRWQHDQASQLMLRLIHMIRSHQAGDDAYPIALQLARWVSLLRGHLASEDEWLYPAMIASGTAVAAATAEEFQAEMGHLAQQLEHFDRQWSSSAVIGANFSQFRREAYALFAELNRRIAREDQFLYPLAERHVPDALPRAA